MTDGRCTAHSLCLSDEQKLLVELACSTTLSPIYYPKLLDAVIHREKGHRRPVLVFIVCGGVGISLAELQEYATANEVEEFWLDNQVIKI